MYQCKTLQNDLFSYVRVIKMKQKRYQENSEDSKILKNKKQLFTNMVNRLPFSLIVNITIVVLNCCTTGKLLCLRYLLIYFYPETLNIVYAAPLRWEVAHNNII